MPRTRTGRNAARFCSLPCKKAYWREQQRRARANAAGDARGYVHIAYHGELLILTRFEIDAARRRGQEFTARATAREGAELLVDEVLALLGIRRSRLYQLMEHNGFPRPIIRPGERHRAVWSEAAVLEWLCRRSRKRDG